MFKLTRTWTCHWLVETILKKVRFKSTPRCKHCLLPMLMARSVGNRRHIVVVVTLCHVRLFVTLWIAARQASLSSLSPWVCSNSCPSSRCLIQSSHPLSPHFPPALNLSQCQGLFQWASSSHRCPKYWSFSISPANEYSVLIAFRVD